MQAVPAQAVGAVSLVRHVLPRSHAHEQEERRVGEVDVEAQRDGAGGWQAGAVAWLFRAGRAAAPV
jgi:hypothetical protein